MFSLDVYNNFFDVEWNTPWTSESFDSKFV